MCSLCPALLAASGNATEWSEPPNFPPPGQLVRRPFPPLEVVPSGEAALSPLISQLSPPFLSLAPSSFADYGCMLEIRQIELLADGRSLVDTIGRRRFRVLSRGHRDGYNTADIEYLEDKKVRAGPGQKPPLRWDRASPWTPFCVPLPSTQVAGEELQELQCLHENTYRLAQRFCEHGDLASRHILMQHGPLPEKEEDIQVTS